ARSAGNQGSPRPPPWARRPPASPSACLTEVGERRFDARGELALRTLDERDHVLAPQDDVADALVAEAVEDPRGDVTVVDVDRDEREEGQVRREVDGGDLRQLVVRADRAVQERLLPAAEPGVEAVVAGERDQRSADRGARGRERDRAERLRRAGGRDVVGAL